MANLPNYGSLGEERVAEAAGAWGLPDFVFQPIEVSKGGARREVGDRLVWVGHQVVIVSVKTLSSPQDSEQRARAWLDKHVSRANRQINGTYRTLKNPPTELVLRSGRGVEVPWDPDAMSSCCGVVVVDYDRPIKYEPHLEQIKVPTVAMVADDWELLTSTLMSTASLANYIELRAAVGVTISFGHEDYLLNQVLLAESLGERERENRSARIP